ncbi:hypothetical protein GA0070604_4266 [Micromonospora eburnea]|uniref:DUF4190 domain-containing protein n=2 Tax=Micromonospora eburnea TaxID=227316 RepID=A0A1C6V306_9ACTN|nr:hypothetical protein GA0070604_4266 [Micromonospora eburnea]
MTGQLSENQRRYSPLAITACCMGLVPLLFASAGYALLIDLNIRLLLPALGLAVCAVAVGVAGLKEIKTTGQRGRGLAIAECVAGAAVFAVLAFSFLYLMVVGPSPAGCAPPAPCW